MIKSFYEINVALDDLRKQLMNRQSNKYIKESIQKLLDQVKYLEEEQKSKFYFLISEIYATKFQNIQQAEAQLAHFDQSLNTQIYMNCELRFAFYNYFQLNYKQATRHLQVALGYVEEQLKLTNNAKFFFGRVINIPNLENEVKENRNFEAAFILSLVQQNQKSQTSALKLIESFLDQEIDQFQKYQTYQRLLQIYQIMKKNSISTISISKKALQTYKQNLNNLKVRYPQFQSDYTLKFAMMMKIIKFINGSNSPKNQKYLKRMLDLKLLAYYKLKKCSKLAPNKHIKLTLMNSAKIIKDSKDTELLEETLNYSFVENEYEKYKILYKYTANQNLLKWKFFNNLCNYEPPKITKPVTVMRKSNIMNQQPITQSRSVSPKPIIKPTTTQNPTKSTKIKKQVEPNYEEEINYMKETTSEILDEEFTGSVMIKINASSQGYEERYFYIKPQSLVQKPRLYYCESANKKNVNDSYYSLKGLSQIEIGKQTQAFQRKDTAKFNAGQCFSLIFSGDKNRNFYVPNKMDFNKWIITLQSKLIRNVPDLSKMKSTMAISTGKSLKKSRKVVFDD